MRVVFAWSCLLICLAPFCVANKYGIISKADMYCVAAIIGLLWPKGNSNAAPQ